MAQDPQLLSNQSLDFIYGPTGLPVEQTSTSGTYYYFQDRNGSTRILLSTSGSISSSFSYSESGSLTAASGSVSTPILYDGAIFDSGSGLYYLLNRFYDPTTGQFVSVDPLVNLTSESYAFVNGNPVNQVDPTGLWSVNPFTDLVEVWNDTGGHIVHAIYQHWRGVSQVLLWGGIGASLSGALLLASGLGWSITILGSDGALFDIVGAYALVGGSLFAAVGAVIIIAANIYNEPSAC